MRLFPVALLILLAACSGGMTEEQREQKEEADVAFVQGLQAKDPPPKPIEPQAIRYPDIEEYNLFGANCAFAPGNSLGAIVIAMDDDAWMKVDDDMIRLAADVGGDKLPMGTWKHYDGKEYTIDLDIGQASASPAASGTVNYPGSVEIRDAYGQLVYGAKGTVQCGA